jgi:branched-subunit amino acid transport protein
MSTWAAVVAAGVGTYLLRISMVVLAARRGVPDWLERVTGHAVPAAFAALATAALGRHVGFEAAALAPLGALVVAVIVVWRTGSSPTAVLAGMPTLWLLSALFG